VETSGVQQMPNITTYTALWIETRQMFQVASYTALYAEILGGRPMSNVASYTALWAEKVCIRPMPQVTAVTSIHQRIEACSPDNFFGGVRGTLLMGLKWCISWLMLSWLPVLILLVQWTLSSSVTVL